jgi:hypothetical protein
VRAIPCDLDRSARDELSLVRLSPISGADSVVSSESAHVRDRGLVLLLDRLLTHEDAALNGFAHVEEALHVAPQGAPYGFRYAWRLLNVDFSPRAFHISAAYRAVYISGWPTSNGRRALLQWTYNIPHIVGAIISTSSSQYFLTLTSCDV